MGKGVHANECPPSNTLYDHEDIQLQEDLLRRKEKKRKTHNSPRRQDGRKQENHLGENKPIGKEKDINLH